MQDHLLEASLAQSEEIAALARAEGLKLGLATHCAGVPLLIDALAIATAEMIGPVASDATLIATGHLVAGQFAEMLAVRCEQVREKAATSA